MDKALVVLHPPLGSACLLPLLFGHLGSLPSCFRSRGQGTMDFTSEQVWPVTSGGVSASAPSTLTQGSLSLKGRGCREHHLLPLSDGLQ